MYDEHDKKFLNKRTRLISLWNPVAITMLIILFALFVWLVIKTPYLINPIFVIETIKENTINQSTLSLSLLMLPIVVLIVFFIMLILILYGFVIMRNEKRYLTIIHSLEKKVENDNKSNG